MKTPPPRFAWERPVKEIWNDLSDPQFVPDMPYYSKLSLLAQLKIAEAIAGYTKWLTVLTVVIALGAIIQAVFTALSYFHPHAS
jgi:hypothetical protein